MGDINTGDFFYKGMSGDEERERVDEFMFYLAGLAENAKRFLRKNNVEITSARFKELEAIDDENVIDSFNCRMGQPTMYSDATLSTKEANPISHDDFPLASAVKVIKWTSEALLVFKDIEGMSMDAVGAKSAIIGLAYHVSLIDRVTNSLNFSEVLDSAKNWKSASYLRPRPLHKVVEEIYWCLVEERGDKPGLPKYGDVVDELERDPRVRVDSDARRVTYGASKPIAFSTIQSWLSEYKKK